MNQNAKLGYTKDEFYRPLFKCRQKGGPVPLVCGYVVRMFTINDKTKKNSVYSHHYT